MEEISGDTHHRKTVTSYPNDPKGIPLKKGLKTCVCIYVCVRVNIYIYRYTYKNIRTLFICI